MLDTVSRPHFMASVGGQLLLSNSTYRWFVQQYSPGTAVTVGYSPADGIYRVATPGSSISTDFGPSDIVFRDTNVTSYAHSQTSVGVQLRQYVFAIHAVGPGTNLSSNHYATLGYFGYDFGDAGRTIASGNRYRFAAGSYSQSSELPAAGVKTYRITGIVHDAFGPAYVGPKRDRDYENPERDKPLDAEVTATVQADFAQRKVYVTLNISTSESYFPLDEDTVSLTLEEYAGDNFFGGTGRASSGMTASANVIFFGPNAEEVGLGFGTGHPSTGLLNDVSILGGAAVGVAE